MRSTQARLVLFCLVCLSVTAGCAPTDSTPENVDPKSDEATPPVRLSDEELIRHRKEQEDQERARIAELNEEIQTHKAEYGPDHAKTLDSMYKAANYLEKISGFGKEERSLREEIRQFHQRNQDAVDLNALDNLRRLARLYHYEKRDQDALLLLNQVLTMHEQRVANHPEFKIEKLYVALTLNQIAGIQDRNQEYDLAVESYQRVEVIIKEWNESEKERASRALPAMSSVGGGLYYSRARANAVKDINSIFTRPLDEWGDLLSVRVKYLLKHGNLKEAIATSDRIKDHAGETAFNRLVRAADAYALCAQEAQKRAKEPGTPDPQKLADTAMQLLKSAREQGLRYSGRLRQSHSFDILRDRADFKELLQQLEPRK